jgi:hypothetical protein
VQTSGEVRRPSALITGPHMSGQFAMPGAGAPPHENGNGNGHGNGNGNGAIAPAYVPGPQPDAGPAPAGPKRRRGRKLALAGGLAVLAVGVAGGAFAALSKTPEPVLAVRPVESKIATLVKKQTPVDGVRCPADVPDRPGIRFACRVDLAQTNQSWLAIVTHRAGGDDIQIRLR